MFDSCKGTSPHIMRPILALLAAGCAVAACATPRPSSPPSPTTGGRDAALASIVAAERGFADMAAGRGTRAAFLEHLADDGLMFLPRAVNGKAWLLADTARFVGGVLEWEPAWADVALAGDLGWTHGPYALRRSAADTVAGRGTFVTVWARDARGRWRAIVDMGAPQSSGAVRADYRARTDMVAHPADAPLAGDTAGVASALTAMDANGLGVEAWRATLRDDARVFRPGEPLRIGIAAAPLAERVARERRTPTGARVAASGDFAATWGTVEAPEEGNYLRVWRRDAGGAWHLALDEVVPVPGRR
jgi:ketosteroid isomerase-like protein